MSHKRTQAISKRKHLIGCILGLGMPMAYAQPDVTPPDLQPFIAVNDQNNPTHGVIPQTVEKGATITRVDFSGATVISADTLKALPEVTQLVGQSSKDTGAVNTAVRAVVTELRRQGFLVANATAKITGDVVNIVIYEGKLDTIKIDNKTNYSDEDLLAYASRALCQDAQPGCAGEPLLSSNSERMIGILSDLPRVKDAQLILSPGSAPGRTQPLVSLKQGASWNGYASADNYGGKLTGKNRLTLGIVGNNWAGIGDQFVGEVSSSDESGNVTGQLGYSVPVGHDGWRAGLNYARNQYVLGEDLAALDAKGQSDTFSLYTTYPIIRSQENNLYFRGGVDTGKASNTILGVKQPSADTYGLNLGVNGRNIDHVYGRSLTNYGITYAHGRISPKDDSYHGIVGGYDKFNWSFDRDQELVPDLESARISAFIGLRGQETRDTLDGSQKFSLGGPSGVRAYPSGEAAGDRGILGKIELRVGYFIQPAFINVALFHDRGWKRDVNSIQDSVNKKVLSASGVSASVSISDRYSLSVIWAEKGKHSPTALTESNPSSHRLWIQATLNF